MLTWYEVRMRQSGGVASSDHHPRVAARTVARRARSRGMIDRRIGGSCREQGDLILARLLIWPPNRTFVAHTRSLTVAAGPR